MQYEIYWVNLDPTQGSEINKTRPGVVISPNESNKHLNTVIIAPLTSKIRRFPMRITIKLNNKLGQIALDQIRCIDKLRIKSSLGSLSTSDIKNLKQTLQKYLVD